MTRPMTPYAPPEVSGALTRTMIARMMMTPTAVTAVVTTRRMTEGTTTTDSRDVGSAARSQRSGVSLRTRITLAVALLVALALTGSGAIVYLIEHDRNREQAPDEVDQEIEEFIRFQEGGVDPRTGEPFGGWSPCSRSSSTATSPARPRRSW